MSVSRLKQKMGTRQLPTAEMVLRGVTATLISKAGAGVKLIASHMVIHSSYHSAYRMFFALMELVCLMVAAAAAACC